MSKEMDLDLIKQNSQVHYLYHIVVYIHPLLFHLIYYIILMYCQVERVIAERVSKDSLDDVVPEYLVKWQGLSYAEATWLVILFSTYTVCTSLEYKASSF